MNDGLVVVGSILVGADTPTVLDDPAEGAFDHTDPGTHVESGAAGAAFDDLDPKGENVCRPTEQSSRVAAVGPDE